MVFRLFQSMQGALASPQSWCLGGRLGPPAPGEVFGAYFGLACCAALGGAADETLNGSCYTSDLFSLIGTVRRGETSRSSEMDVGTANMEVTRPASGPELFLPLDLLAATSI